MRVGGLGRVLALCLALRTAHAQAPGFGDLGRSEPGSRQLMVTLSNGRRVTLLPTFADLARIESAAAGRPVTPPAPVTPPPWLDFGPDVAALPQPVLDRPWTADFHDYFRARAAAGEVPTALAGMALEPVARKGYQVVDRVPAAIRRPFDRGLGILLDTAVSAPGNLLTAHVPYDGPLPDVMDLKVRPYPQINNSCGETMVATWLKSQGVPIALGEVDTQVPFFEGTNSLEEAELRKRGFTLVSGPGSMRDLKTYLANGYPVMVNVGWEGGGGHYAVVTGYDDRTGELLIDSWNADGEVARVPYAKFTADWSRHRNLMVVAHPERDHRLDALRQRGVISRTARIQPGLSLSEIWVTQRLEFYIETAYRYQGQSDDLTVRANVSTDQRQGVTTTRIGASLGYTHRFGPNTVVNVYAEKLPVRTAVERDGWQDVMQNVALYVGAQHRNLSGRAGYEHGAFQAAVQAELNNRLASMGAEARVGMGLDGTYQVFLGASGTF